MKIWLDYGELIPGKCQSGCFGKKAEEEQMILGQLLLNSSAVIYRPFVLLSQWPEAHPECPAQPRALLLIT